MRAHFVISLRASKNSRLGLRRARGLRQLLQLKKGLPPDSAIKLKDFNTK